MNRHYVPRADKEKLLRRMLKWIDEGIETPVIAKRIGLSYSRTRDLKREALALRGNIARNESSNRSGGVN